MYSNIKKDIVNIYIYIVTEFKQGIDHLGISYYFDLKFECRSNIAFL